MSSNSKLFLIFCPSSSALPDPVPLLALSIFGQLPEPLLPSDWWSYLRELCPTPSLTFAWSRSLPPDLARFLPTLENWETELGGGGLDMYWEAIFERV